MLRTTTRAVTAAAISVLVACTHRVAVDPIKVEPIDITLHIFLEADEKLDSFFDYQGEPAAPPADPTPDAPAAEPVPAEGGPR